MATGKESRRRGWASTLTHALKVGAVAFQELGVLFQQPLLQLVTAVCAPVWT